MNKFLKILKSLVYPVTLLTLISLYAIYVSIQSLIIAYTHDHTAAIYAAVVIPITLIILLFYVLDRVLILTVNMVGVYGMVARTIGVPYCCH